MITSNTPQEIALEPSWKTLLQNELEADYFQNLRAFVNEEYLAHACYPPADKIFAAFDACPVARTKVVILGQDPYHGPGQANGLCFSVADGMAHPPSLRNIFKELKSDVGKEEPKSGNLQSWAEQGVLLLNATLSVRAHEAGSHQNRGWERFTDAAIAQLAKETEHVVFILWGAYAQKKAQRIAEDRHLILKAPHPSPLSAHRGFFGSSPFSKTNTYLLKHGIQPIYW